jgi:cell division protein FtsL
MDEMAPGQRAGLLRGRIAMKEKAIEQRKAEINELQMEILHLSSEVIHLDMQRMSDPQSTL